MRLAVEVTLRRRWVALATLCAVLSLTFLDNTMVSVALADMQTSLSAGVSDLQWIVNGYMLAFTGGTPLGAPLIGAANSVPKPFAPPPPSVEP